MHKREKPPDPMTILGPPVLGRPGVLETIAAELAAKGHPVVILRAELAGCACPFCGDSGLHICTGPWPVTHDAAFGPSKPKPPKGK